MKVSEVLRQAADEIPQHEDELRSDRVGDRIGESYGLTESVYICDNIRRILKTGWGETSDTAEFLEELGMGCGFHVFHHIKAGVERQAARVAWLLFAADLADEWGI